MGLIGAESPSDEKSPERLSLDELRQVQLERLRRSIRHACENVLHYQRRFAEHGVSPQDLHTLEDLARFPFLTKQDFRANYPFGLFAVPRDKIVRIHTSSGTSGKPTVVGYSAEDLQIWARLVGRCIRAAGARTGDIVHIAYDYGLFTGGLGSHAGAEHLGCTAIPVSSGRSAWQIELMEDFRPDILMATPSYALNLANAFEARGLDPHESSLRIGIFGAEPWSETTRAALQLRLGLEAFDLYGLAEVMGPGVACESAGGALGLTLWEDHVYPEVIDPSTGRVLPDGEEGELVLTSLTKEALPVIRYRTHDLTRLLPPQQGPMRRIARVSARTDDMLVIHGVNVFPSQIDALLARSGGFSPHYKLEISRSGPLDDLTVHAEILSRQYQSDAQLRAAADDLMQEIKTFIGVSVTVVVHRAGTIEWAPGKATRLFEPRAAAR